MLSSFLRLPRMIQRSNNEPSLTNAPARLVEGHVTTEENRDDDFKSLNLTVLPVRQQVQFSHFTFLVEIESADSGKELNWLGQVAQAFQKLKAFQKTFDIYRLMHWCFSSTKSLCSQNYITQRRIKCHGSLLGFRSPVALQQCSDVQAPMSLVPTTYSTTKSM